MNVEGLHFCLPVRLPLEICKMIVEYALRYELNESIKNGQTNMRLVEMDVDIVSMVALSMYLGKTI